MSALDGLLVEVDLLDPLGIVNFGVDLLLAADL